MTDDTELDFSLLPDDLQPLATLIARYAASDDVERSGLFANASTEELVFSALQQIPIGTQSTRS